MVYFYPMPFTSKNPLWGDRHTSQGRVITSERQRKCFVEVHTSWLFSIKSLALKESQHQFYAKNTRLERIWGDGDSQGFQAAMRYTFSRLGEGREARQKGNREMRFWGWGRGRWPYRSTAKLGHLGKGERVLRIEMLGPQAPTRTVPGKPHRRTCIHPTQGPAPGSEPRTKPRNHRRAGGAGGPLLFLLASEKAPRRPLRPCLRCQAEGTWQRSEMVVKTGTDLAHLRRWAEVSARLTVNQRTRVRVPGSCNS